MSYKTNLIKKNNRKRRYYTTSIICLLIITVLLLLFYRLLSITRSALPHPAVTYPKINSNKGVVGHDLNKNGLVLQSLSTEIDLSQLPKGECDSGNILTVVAHQDDDLLFMNPDHIKAYHKGKCLRTIYLTAGDAGIKRSSYWINREKGSLAAYNTLAGTPKYKWNQNLVKLNDHQSLIIYTTPLNPKISLIFVRLPDGNTTGSGYVSTQYSSLEYLEKGKISKIYSVDGKSYYTSNDVVNLIDKLINFYHPSQIDTQVSINLSDAHHDHSDHLATGFYTRSAIIQYASRGGSLPAINYYVGYPIQQYAENVTGKELTEKEKMFYAYVGYDGFTCQNEKRCKDDIYNKFLKRQYKY